MCLSEEVEAETAMVTVDRLPRVILKVSEMQMVIVWMNAVVVVEAEDICEDSVAKKSRVLMSPGALS